jgi:cytochrome c oxidase subunit 2
MSDPYAQDDIVLSELHIPVGKKIHFRMRSQDVLHSAYMPHFRAQMNCVPGMVTEFAFVPTITTAEYRELPFMIKKVQNINDIRSKKSIELVAKGEAALDPYEFDYLLLCNKICGASHYNMQMKIVVDTPEDYKKWLSEKATLLQEINKAKAAEAVPAQGTTPASDSIKKDSSKTVVAENKMALK